MGSKQLSLKYFFFILKKGESAPKFSLSTYADNFEEQD
jgi:hypothetical protein